MKIDIWTDGSCSPNPGPGGWAWHCSEGRRGFGGDIRTTNNKMELTAILKALQALPDGTNAVIYSDSQYCVKGMTIWHKKWKQNSWMRKGEPMPNRDLWIELNNQVSRLSNVAIKWVRGHNGDQNNELADMLAELGRQSILKESKK